MGASNLGCVTLQFIYIHFPVLCEPSLLATALSQATSRCVFQLPSQTPHIRSHSRKRVTHSLSPTGPHTTAHTSKQGRFGRGAIITLGAFRTFANLPGSGIRTAYVAAFGSWSGALPKNAESLRSSDALMCVAAPRRRGPAGLRNTAAVTSTCFEGASQAVAETAENTYPPRTVRI